MNISRIVRFCSFAAALLTIGSFTNPAHAQVLYGSIVGSVTDQSSAAVPNATVTITNKQTGSTRTEKSGGDGRYLFGNAQPGTYDVKVEATGFRTVSQTDVSVTANTV